MGRQTVEPENMRYRDLIKVCEERTLKDNDDDLCWYSCDLTKKRIKGNQYYSLYEIKDCSIDICPKRNKR